MTHMILIAKKAKSYFEFVVGAFLDFSEGSDTVNYDIPLTKLHNYGNRDSAM